jgi:two-component sensor histidine kinase
VKHAFHDVGHPEVSLAMAQRTNGLDVIVRDNGSGLPDEPARRSGSDLVAALATSAGIAVTVESHGGTEYRLHLKRTKDSTGPVTESAPSA